MMTDCKAVLAAAVLAMVPAAGAFGAEYSGTGGAIADSTSSGTAAWTEFDIEVSGTGATVDSFDSVTLTGLDHTWIGDLYMQVNAPDGTGFVLFAPPDQSDANFDGTYTFVAEGDYPTIDEGLVGLGNADDLPEGTYFASNYGGSVEKNTLGPRENWSLEGGIPLDGTWTLLVGDYGVGDVGSLSEWSFAVTPVPEPATAGIMALGGLTLLRRRR